MTRLLLAPALAAILLIGCDATGPTDSSALAPGGPAPAEARGGSDDGPSGLVETEVRGVLTAVGDASVTMGGQDFKVHPRARLLDRDNDPIPLSAFSPGEFVQVEYVVLDGQNVLTKMKKEDGPPGAPEREIVGRLTAVGASSVTLAGEGFSISSGTRLVDRRNQPLTLADFAPGDRVEIDYIVFDGQNIATKMKKKSR